MNLWSMDNNAQNLVLKRLLEQANKENPTVEFDIDAVAAKLSATAITLTISSFDIDRAVAYAANLQMLTALWIYGQTATPTRSGLSVSDHQKVEDFVDRTVGNLFKDFES